ncbi:hypothetical protein FIBSPDRAFT_554443 [Athelia psychrophila]|uniref:Uncharacterized protein n=1 Tax=Athelia psychrophila TaxID=1759441 RepID=A0A166IMR1_9AGAM|nr:hypothetical protein FIBSPDRAFT_554443 [Fibularhizoctonia sp. CBS 109695]
MHEERYACLSDERCAGRGTDQQPVSCTMLGVESWHLLASVSVSSSLGPSESFVLLSSHFRYFQVRLLRHVVAITLSLSVIPCLFSPCTSTSRIDQL